jgi:predicted O-methyltransferase YrrM
MTTIGNDVDELVAKLGRRSESFGLVVEFLRRLGRKANVVETGCIHSLDDYGAGYSTMLWELLSREIELRIVSIDIMPAHIAFAKHLCPCVRFIRGDSVFTLHMMQGAQIDVLYLDAFDPDQSAVHHAALHGLMELTAAAHSLRSGSLVLVDDYYGKGTGKGAYVSQFMELTGRRLLHDGLQKVWRW